MNLMMTNFFLFFLPPLYFWNFFSKFFSATIEHKNMPLDDALGLVDRDFERYCLDVREGHIPARTPRQSKPDMSSLLSKVASGEQLRPEQLDVIINTLQRQKESSANEVRAPAPSVGMLRRPEG